ncbi:MAG: hypothetical protein U9R05_06605 [Chloroflexota bacterium]|nr:hypothetical protein [Chloroflexota bacterium]
MTDSLPGEREVITDYPEGCSKYEWIHHVPKSTNTHHFFVGVSEEKHAAEADARNHASIDCISQFARHCGVEIKLYYNYLAVSYGKSSEVTDPTVAMKDSRQHIVDAFVSRLKPREYCAQRIEKFSDTSKTESSWKAYVLATVPVDEVQKVKDYKPPEPPPPLSLHVTNMGNNRYCIEVRSHLGMPVENFRLLENGRPIFPNAYCLATNYNYQINNDTATLDFSSTGSILLGGENDIFSFYLPKSGAITVNYSIDNKHYSFFHKYGLSD